MIADEVHHQALSNTHAAQLRLGFNNLNIDAVGIRGSEQQARDHRHAVPLLVICEVSRRPCVDFPEVKREVPGTLRLLLPYGYPGGEFRFAFSERGKM